MKKLFYFLFIVFFLFESNSQQTPASNQSEIIAIKNGIANIGNGNIIKNSLIIFKNGVLQFVGKYSENIDLSNMKVIEANGMNIYPGFILPNSTLGLIEIDAVRASDDVSEIGTWNPNIRSLIAYNTESRVVETMRPNGVLLAQITPRGGIISGKSSIVQLDAWNWEDAAIKIDDGIHINWPNSIANERWNHSDDSYLKFNKNYRDKVNKIINYFNNARAHNSVSSNVTNIKFEAMKGLFDNKIKLYIHVSEKKGIIDAVTFAKNQKIKNITIVGGYESHKVTSFLKENNISVLLQRVHLRPENNYEDYDLPYKLAKKLVDEGILVGLEASGDMERMNSRNLPFYAGTTVAHGLSKSQALKLITFNTAKILGIENKYGSLEIGKSATLFISTGDALDIRTNNIKRAFIDGRDISLESHQTKLWKRYKKKYILN